jgi:hypothetical protein
MQTTTAEKTEARAVKVSRNSKAWENLGVKFRQSPSIEFSLDGKIGSYGRTRLDWSAWHKGGYLTGGGKEVEDVVEYMNNHSERYLLIIAKRNSRK